MTEDPLVAFLTGFFAGVMLVVLALLAGVVTVV